MPLPFDNDLTRPEFHCINEGRISKPSEFKIYPISQLGLLLQTLRVQTPPKHTILYCVDDNGQIWFAGEAAPDPNIITEFLIPMHYQMTGVSGINAYCMTAGNFELSIDYKEIIRIDNKSSTFKPTFDSLKWALASLVVNASCLETQSIRLAPELLIEEYSDGVGRFQGRFHTLDTAEFVKWVETTFEGEKQRLLKQPTEIKTVTYKPSSITANRYHSLAVGFGSGEGDIAEAATCTNEPRKLMNTY